MSYPIVCLLSDDFLTWGNSIVFLTDPSLEQFFVLPKELVAVQFGMIE